MIESIQTGKRGLVTQAARHDLIAHNLANTATTGFKRQVARFTLEQRADDPAARELVVRSQTDPTGGSVTRTGRDFDIAIDGDGFFVVEANGQERYTRSGDFRLNEDGEVVTQSGHRLLSTSGPIVIDPQEGVPRIATDGTVTVGESNQGQIRVVRFADPSVLRREAGNLYVDTAGAAQDVDPAEVSLLSGFIEGSNVNAIREMVTMISALRAYQAMERVVQSSDEILDTMINRVGRAPESQG